MREMLSPTQIAPLVDMARRFQKFAHFRFLAHSFLFNITLTSSVFHFPSLLRLFGL